MKRVSALLLCAVLLFTSFAFSIGAETDANGLPVAYVDYRSGADTNSGDTPDAPKKLVGSTTGSGIIGKVPNGGTIVATDLFYIGATYTLNAGGPITVTANWGGIDYKDSNPNKRDAVGCMKLKTGVTLTLKSDLILDDLILLQDYDQNTIVVKSGATLTVTDKVVCGTVQDYYMNIVVEEGGTANLYGGIFSDVAGDGEVNNFGATILSDLPDTSPRQTVCYMDFTNGADTNDSLTAQTPIKSYANGAWKKLPSGGTVVVTGKSHIGTDYEFAALGGPLTITSVYGGVDYKNPEPASNPACAWKIDDAKVLTFNSDIIFDNIILFQYRGQNTLIFNAGATLTVTDTVVFMSTGEEHFRIVLNEGATAILSEAAQEAFTIENNGGRVLTYGETHTHNYVETVLTPATCLPGLSRYTCAECGYSYTAVTASAAAHTFGAWTAAEAGYDRTCAACGTVDHSDFLPGDADGNGKINIRDAALVLQHLADWEVTLTLGAADADGNGEVTLQDALCILQYIAAFDVELCKADTPETPAVPNTDAVTELLAISQLVQVSEDGDHAEDETRSASLETNYREVVILNSETTGYTRYDNAYYPRVKKVRDDLYLLLFMYSQYGQHLYYATSSDGLHWNPPQVLWNSADHKFTYAYGSLAGTDDRYHAVNADALVLPSGEVLCVYAVRAVKGYRTYADLCGLFMKRGTPTADGNITWSAEQKIYTGQVWEPSILQRTDGQIHVYFSECAPGIMYYGYHEEHRTVASGLIVSDDNGKTWTPNIEAGDTNYYRTPVVFQEYVGNMDYTKENGETINYAHYCAQMPVGVQLYNGKILLAAEIKQTDGKFRISYVISEDNGEWKELAWNAEENETIYKLTNTPNSSPYVDRFLSGEVYLTHNYGSELRGHIGSPDGTYMSSAFRNAPGCAGIWGSCAVVDSHRAITAMHNTLGGGKYSIHLYYGYLNHRINAPKAAIAVNGYTGDWDAITDALFVGSESQAQFTTRVAHDAENIYFLLSRLDDYLAGGDVTSVSIAAGETASYRIDVDGNGKATLSYYANGACKSTRPLDTVAATVLGTVGFNKDTDTGAIYEIAVPKADLGLADGAKEICICPSLVNVDGLDRTEDTLSGASAIFTAAWPKVVLD